MNLFNVETLTPNTEPYAWRLDILLLNVGSDIIITLCYLSIPILLSIVLLKRKDIPYRTSAWLFILFIFFCALTHITEIINIWCSCYLISGIIKGITAIIAVISTYIIVKNLPKILKLPSLEYLEQRISNNMYHVMQRLPVGVIFSNKEGKILYHNQYISNLFGFTDDELAGQPVEMLMPQHVREHHVKYKNDYFNHPTEKAMGAGRVLEGQTKSGMLKALEVGLRPISIGNMDSSQTLITIKDITREEQHKKQIEEALHLINIATFRMPSLLSYINTKGYYVLVNGAYSKRWKVRPQDIVGKHFSELLPPELAKAVNERITAALTGEEQNFKMTVNFPEEPPADLDVFYIPHINEDTQEVEGVVVLAHDITDLNKTLNDLEESNKQLEEYAFLVSHDLRAPIRHISNFVELLYAELEAEQPNKEKIENHIDVITNNSKKIQGMITGMLKIASIREITPSETSFLLIDLLNNLKDRYKNKAILELIMDENLEIHSDQDLLNSVFVNLIENSIAFANSSKAKIQINVTTSNSDLEIDYKDQGSGISADIAESIFDPFKKSENSKGLGLGMAIVTRSLDKINGSIKCIPSAKGAKFKIELPQ